MDHMVLAMDLAHMEVTAVHMEVWVDTVVMEVRMEGMAAACMEVMEVRMGWEGTDLMEWEVMDEWA
jgi:hypothetical protein